MRAPIRKLIVLGLWAVVASPINAAEPRWPTPDEMEAARNRAPTPSLDDILRQAPRSIPNVKPQRPALDLEGMARRYSANREAFAGATTREPQLRIFVTLAMPEASLKLLAEQAAKTKATIVIRGLKDESMKSTLAAVQRVIGQLRVDWQIDPPAFSRFSIARAPTFVLIAPIANGVEPRSCTTCDMTNSFISVSGDVSLDYALGVIARARPAFATDAQRFLSRLDKQAIQ